MEAQMEEMQVRMDRERLELDKERELFVQDRSMLQLQREEHEAKVDRISLTSIEYTHCL